MGGQRGPVLPRTEQLEMSEDFTKDGIFGLVPKVDTANSDWWSRLGKGV